MGHVSISQSISGKNLAALSLNDDAIKFLIFNLKNKQIIGKRLEKFMSVSEND